MKVKKLNGKSNVLGKNVKNKVVKKKSEVSIVRR